MVEEEEGKLVLYHAETVHAVIFPKHLEFSEYVNNWITTGIKQYQIPLVHTHTKKNPHNLSRVSQRNITISQQLIL